MLFKDTIKLKEYAQLTATDFNAIKSVIKSVEDKHIISIISRSVFEELDAAYNEAANEDALNTPMKLLLEQCRKVIGPYVCVYYAPKSDVSLSDAGMRRQETATAKTAYQYQGKKFIEANQEEADAATENLIHFLETKKEDYPAWIESDEYKLYRSLFIKTGTEFNTYFATHSPHRNYLAVRAKMFDVEEMAIIPFLGDELFTDLKTKDTEGTELEAEETALLFKIKKAIAAFTIAQAVPFLNVRIAANGLTIVSTGTFTSNDDTTSRAAATDSAINLFVKNANDAGQRWLKSATDHLVKHKTIFTTWPGNIVATSTKTDCKPLNTFGLT